MASRSWEKIKQYEEIFFEYFEGIAKITINRERYRNAFTPTTVTEMSDALNYCRNNDNIGIVVITGAGDTAFCSGGDMNVKGHGGYIGKDGVARLNILDVQKQIRSLPKPVVAMVNGYAIGGGHVLHVVCDLSIASENAIFGQTGPRVGSFDAGFGSSYLARIIGQKRAREFWFMCQKYTAQEAFSMGLVNKVSGSRLKKCGHACTHCRACLEICPVDIQEVYEDRENGDITHPDCIYCLKCIEVCPEKDALYFELFGIKLLKSKRMVKGK